MYSIGDFPLSKRDALINAAKTLLWEQGFEAMSPKKVMRLSGAGQGSLYHHFGGKQDLALTALAEVDTEMRASMAEVFSADKDPMDRLYDYLTGPRDELKGCKLGRLVGEKTVLNSDICGVIGQYFDHVSQLLQTALEDAKAAGDLPPFLDAGMVAKSLAAMIQGGYILARGSGNPQAMQQAQEGAWMMLEGLSSR
jgi:AcrR family transcriptional regulator